MLGLSLAACLVPVARAETMSVVIRTFIPGEHPGKPGYMLPVPGQAGLTMLPKAPLAQCFGTDSRGFSDKRAASSRFGGEVVVDIGSGSAPVLKPILGVTHEYNCDTGTVVCEKPSGDDGFSISDIDVSPDVVTFSYNGAASNPCFFGAPNIRFKGTVRIDRTTRQVTIDAMNDVFPSFEAVLFTSAGAKSLFRMKPEGDATPVSLLTSSASRPASGSASF
ncbi:hypothetical protein [Mesorhizobium sp. M0019]|uniref:hypothetical protein n=1 Tax=Mesorhizobium sp. M0019 TaxID=2956845 RepID=UPI00333B9CC0